MEKLNFRNNLSMKNKTIFLSLLAGISLISCSVSKMEQPSPSYSYNYTPDSQQLYDTIARLDSIFFTAYNNCNMKVQAEMYADTIEFYHDQGGLSTSKKDILEATERNICGKVTRELIKGSLEVYPINNYGAVEIGLHKFHNNTQTEDSKSGAGRFVIVWRHKNNKWQMTRIISLH
jgi:ketosteroid isomerase-like protein